MAALVLANSWKKKTSWMPLGGWIHESGLPGCRTLWKDHCSPIKRNKNLICDYIKTQPIRLAGAGQAQASLPNYLTPAELFVLIVTCALIIMKHSKDQHSCCVLVLFLWSCVSHSFNPFPLEGQEAPLFYFLKKTGVLIQCLRHHIIISLW